MTFAAAVVVAGGGGCTEAPLGGAVVMLARDPLPLFVGRPLNGTDRASHSRSHSRVTPYATHCQRST